MAKRLLAKLELTDENTLKLKIEERSWKFPLNEYMDNLIYWTTDMLGFYYVKKELAQENNSLESLHKLMKKGFAIRFDEMEDFYSIIISKSVSSANFKTAKDKGVTQLLIEAENWATEMLEELEHNNTI